MNQHSFSFQYVLQSKEHIFPPSQKPPPAPSTTLSFSPPLSNDPVVEDTMKKRDLNKTAGKEELCSPAQEMVLEKTKKKRTNK